MQGLVALVVVSLLAGMLARRTRRFPAQTPEAVNALVLNVALPALVLRAMHKVPLEPGLLYAAGMLWLQFGLALGLFALLARFTGMSRGTVGALALTAGLSNTAFVGLPVIEATLGRTALGPAVFVDQLGSFLVVCSLGMVVAAGAAGRKVDLATVARKVLLFPAFMALVASLLLRPFALPPWADLTLLRLGDLLTPLALFSVGFGLRVQGLRERLGTLSAGLTYKLVLSPLVFGAVLLVVEPQASLTWKVTVLQCAMPPMVTGGILAAQHELDPPLAAAMVGVGLPVSVLTLSAVLALVAW
jgi:predicted permease